MVCPRTPSTEGFVDSDPVRPMGMVSHVSSERSLPLQDESTCSTTRGRLPLGTGVPEEAPWGPARTDSLKDVGSGPTFLAED